MSLSHVCIIMRVLSFLSLGRDKEPKNETNTKTKLKASKPTLETNWK